MRIEDLAYVYLVRVAETDGKICPHERALLGRYRKALRVSPDFARRAEQDPDAILDGAEAPSERADPVERRNLLRMMVRLAVHDGHVDRAEEKLLRRFADAFGIGGVEFADILVACEGDSHTRHHLSDAKRSTRRFHVALAVSLLAVAVLVWAIGTRLGRDTSRDHRTIEELRIDFAEVVRALDGEGLEEIRRRERELARLEDDLEERLEAAGETVSREEFELLESRLANVRDTNRTFSEIESDHRRSIVLLFVRYEMRKGRDTRELTSYGSGFFVTPVGHIVTNKHVARPWLYSVAAARLREQGFRLAPESIAMAAWSAGSRVRDAAGNIDFSTAWRSWDERLELVASTPDRLVRMRKRDAHGEVASRFHAQGLGDLAVLRAKLAAPVPAVLLDEGEDDIRKVDPVMVLGFPKTFSLFETEIAETAPSLGVVRKVEQKIFVDAAIISGNSGGPVFGRDGRAIGVATTSHGDPSLGGCIPVRHVLALLPGADALLAEARQTAVDSGPVAERAALELLDLAMLRGPRGAAFREIETLRRSVEKRVRQRVDAAVERCERGDSRAGRAELEALAAAYGPRFGRGAREALTGR